MTSQEFKLWKDDSHRLEAFAGTARGVGPEDAGAQVDIIELDFVFAALDIWTWSARFDGLPGGATAPKLPEEGTNEVFATESGAGEAPGVWDVGDPNCLVERRHTETVEVVREFR